MWKRLFQRKQRSPAVTPVPVELFTRADCPLCDEMKAELARSRVPEPFDLVEIDIAADPELERAYGLSIPVLRIGGRTAFKGRMDAASFERKFARLARAWRDDPNACRSSTS